MQKDFHWKRQELALTLRKRPEDILLVKPETYMNRSGLAVAALALLYKIAMADILVVQDDMDMPGRGCGCAPRALPAVIGAWNLLASNWAAMLSRV